MRKHRKIIICICLILTTLIAIPTLAVVVTIDGKVTSVTITGNGRRYETYIKKTQDGRYAYCLEERKDSPNGMDMPLGSLVPDQIFRALNFGYPSYNYTNNFDTNYAITQIAVWHLLGQLDANTLNYKVDPNITAAGFRHTDAGSTYKGPLTPEYFKACVMDAIKISQIFNLGQAGSFEVSPKSSVGSLDGKYIVSGEYKISATGTALNGSGSLVATASTDIPGLRVIKDNNYYDLQSVSLKPGDKFKLAVPKYTPSGSVSIKLAGTIDTDKVYTLQSTDSRVQNVAAFQTRHVDASVLDACTFTWDKASVQGTVRLVKKDRETKGVLKGARFGLYTLDGGLVQEATTQSNGIATFANVSPGSYQLKEIEPPPGYELNQTPIPVEVNDGTADVSLDFEFENTPIKHTVSVTKKDSVDKTVLEGARFGIYQNDSLVQEATTNPQGIATFSNLKNGTYQIKEIAPPPNYTASDRVIDVDLANADSTQNLKYDFENDLVLHSVELTKTDSKTGALLEGAVFGLYKDDLEIDRQTTGLNGKLVFSNVRPGTYTVKEITPPVNYQLSDEVLDVVVEKGSQSKTYSLSATNNPVKYKIVVTKKDKETKEVLEGAKFGLYKDGLLVDEKTTNQNGVLEFVDLEKGSYEIKETEAPKDYKLNSQVISFEVGSKKKLKPKMVPPQESVGNSLSYEVLNEPLKHKIVVTKRDSENNKVLEGVVFGLYQDDREITRQTTNNKGVVEFTDLKAGQYVVKEISTIPGYILKADTIDVDIKDQTESKTFSYDFENSPLKHNVTVTKIDSETKKPLQGATIGIYKGSDLVKQGESNSEGIVEFVGLGAGEYTVKEIKAPANYKLTTKTVPVNIGNESSPQTYKATLENEPLKHKVIVKKTDSENGTVLQDVVFGIFSGEQELARATTNEEGLATFDNLKTGNYVIKELETIPDYSLSSEVINVNIGDQTKPQTFEYDYDNAPLKHKIIVTKVDAETQQPLANATLALYKGKELVGKGKSNELGIVEFDNLREGEYSVREIEAPINYELSEEVSKVSIKNQTSSQEFRVTFENTQILNKVSVTKLDSEVGTKLQGAEFAIYQDGRELNRVSTNAKGVATFENLKAGRYQIKEVKPPVNYVQSMEVIDVVIEDSKEAQALSYEFKNSPVVHNIVVTKTDKENGKVLKGASYGLYKDGQVVKKGVTNDEGKITFDNVKTGDYIVKEIEPPINYLLSDEEFEVNIGDQTEGQTFQVEATDTPIKHKVTVTKIDSISKEKVAGAVFTLYQNDKEVKTATSNEKGIATFEDLRPGSYTIKETEAPKNYHKSDKVIEVTIEDGTKSKSYNYEFENEQIQHKVIVTKTDRETNQPLEGAIFGAYSGDKLIRKSKTNAQGVAEFTAMLKGEYTIKELVPPINYQLDSEPQTLRIVDQSASQTFNTRFTNSFIPNEIVIVKKDTETKEVLKDAVFALYQDGQEIARETTGENGEARFTNLRVGNYTVKEVEAPINYHLSEEELSIEIKDTTEPQVLTFDFEDKPVKHSVVITKIDSETEAVLEGAKFGLYQDEEKIAEGVTNEEGKVTFEELRKGNYTIKELEAPLGYRLNEEPTEVEIEDNTEPQVFEYTVSNNPIKFTLELYKREYFEDKPIDDVKFRLVSEGRIVYFPKDDTENKDIAFSDVIKDKDKLTSLDDKDAPKGMTSIFTTDMKGIITFPNKLRLGNYELIELEPKAGYKPLEDSIKFTVDTNTRMGKDLDNLVYRQVVENHIGEGIMELTKKDISTGELLPDTKFKIYAEDRKTVVTKGITDENGIAKFQLPIGKYYYQEYEASVGYQLDDTLFEFEIKENGDIVKCEMTNTPNPSLPKTGSLGSIFPIVLGCAFITLICAFYIMRVNSKR